MDNEQMLFRTVAFGGFQKQDVLAYLEKTAKEHADKLGELEREASASKRLREEADMQVQALQARLAEIGEEYARLESELAQKEEALTLATDQVNGLEAQVAKMKAELTRLAPAADAYEGLKNRTAGIELEAHTRAQAIEEESRQKIQKMRRDLLGWFDMLEAAYARLQNEVGITLTHASSELARAGKEIENLSGSFRVQDETIRSLRAQIEGGDSRPPMPFQDTTPSAGGTVPFSTGDGR